MLQKELQNCSDYLYILQQLFAGPVRLWMYWRFKMQINPQSSWWQRNSDTYRHLGPRPIRPGSPSPRHTANPLRYTSPDPCKQTAWGCRFLELQNRRGKTKNEWVSQQCIQLLASQTYYLLKKKHKCDACVSMINRNQTAHKNVCGLARVWQCTRTPSTVSLSLVADVCFKTK